VSIKGNELKPGCTNKGGGPSTENRNYGTSKGGTTLPIIKLHRRIIETCSGKRECGDQSRGESAQEGRSGKRRDPMDTFGKGDNKSGGGERCTFLVGLRHDKFETG